jgi:hypothetical protein
MALTSRTSISTRMSPYRLPTAGAWSHSVAICCARPSRKSGCIEDPVAIRAILDSLAVSAALLDRPSPAAMMEPALLATKV